MITTYNFKEALDNSYIKRLESLGIQICDDEVFTRELSFSYNHDHAQNMTTLYGYSMLGECLILCLEANSIANKNILNSFTIEDIVNEISFASIIKITFKIG